VLTLPRRDEVIAMKKAADEAKRDEKLKKAMQPDPNLVMKTTTQQLIGSMKAGGYLRVCAC
jgi:hypothetical protein